MKAKRGNGCARPHDCGHDVIIDLGKSTSTSFASSLSLPCLIVPLADSHNSQSMPLRLRTPDFDLLLTLDTFAAGFLLLGSTGVRNDADTRIERLAISLQLIAFSLYVGAIFTAIVGSPSCFFPIAQLMSGQGVLVTFAAVFVAAYARLEEDGKTEFAWSIFIGCVCVFCMPGYILTRAYRRRIRNR